ncbi:GIY-YIG catalytic domain-containing endonuclease [Acanthocystis turfacea Chlorella virus MN0810.1]|nr:GIY-YIG catalytic domain-containing endonuclease [Acanthocystis turfacea Chlorella virus MN0810.1]
MGFIYRLTSPKNKSYVGQTIRPIKERFRDHQYTSSGCKAICGAIQKYGWENMKKEWIEVPDDELNFYEEMLVALIGAIAPGGYNLREGGDSGGKPCEEVKKKMSESRTGDKNHMFGRTGEDHPMFGRTHTEEAKQKMSDVKTGDKNHMFGRTGEDHPRFGIMHTDESKQQMSESNKGEKNPLSKKVYQYDLDGTFIQSFASGGEAARSLNKTYKTRICECANNKRPTAHGFKWSYTKL